MSPVTGIDASVAVVDKLPQEAPALIIESVPENYAGHPGIKNGRGFYDWSGKDINEIKAEASREPTELLAYLNQLG